MDKDNRYYGQTVGNILLLRRVTINYNKIVLNSMLLKDEMQMKIFF